MAGAPGAPAHRGEGRGGSGQTRQQAGIEVDVGAERGVLLFLSV